MQIVGFLKRRLKKNDTLVSAEPENYHEFFYLNTIDGSVNKTRLINASDPRKYVLFIQVRVMISYKLLVLRSFHTNYCYVLTS